MRTITTLSLAALTASGMSQCDPPEDLGYLQINSIVATMCLTGSDGAATPLRLMDYTFELCQLHTNPISLGTTLTVSNSDASEGSLVADDIKYLYMAGYDAANNTSSVAATNASSVKRRVLRVGLDLSSAASDFGSSFSGESIRIGTGFNSLIWALSPSAARHMAFDGTLFPAAYERSSGQPDLRSMVLDEDKIALCRSSSTFPLLRSSAWLFQSGGSFANLVFAPGEIPENPTAMLFRTDENYSYMFLCEHDSLYTYVRKYRWDEGNSYWDRLYGYATVMTAGPFLDLGSNSTAVPSDLFVVTKGALSRVTDDGDSIDYADSVTPPEDYEFRGVSAVGAALTTPPNAVSGTVHLQNLLDESFGTLGKKVFLRFRLYQEVANEYELVAAPEIEMDISNAAGHYQFTLPNGYGAGTYTLQCKGTFWLRDTIEIEVRELEGGKFGCYNANFNVVNGDADMDNEVGIGDYSMISGHWLEEWDVNANEGFPDLNIDGVVDIGDYAIVSANYNLVGDDTL